MKESGKRFIGLDVHKHYLVAIGVDEELNVVLPARHVELCHLESWMKKTLTKQDDAVLEMTTNTWQLYDELVVYAGSVLVVHPPHVALITRSQVMNDKIAASILARLLAKGLLVGVWVPPQEIRELRGLVAQRKKMRDLPLRRRTVCKLSCSDIISFRQKVTSSEHSNRSGGWLCPWDRWKK